MRIFRRFPREFWVLLGGDSVSHLGYGIFAPCGPDVRPVVEAV
jgi:hypothetical protein